MELLVCQPRGAPFLLLGLALLCGQVRSECERRIPNCVGENCVEKVECLNGRCGVDGACECLPCYSGPTCAAYDDKYGPRFAIRLDTVIVNSKHEGVVYKASAEDEDLGLTCPLGPGQHTRCPCARYHLQPPRAPRHPQPPTLHYPRVVRAGVSPGRLAADSRKQSPVGNHCLKHQEQPPVRLPDTDHSSAPRRPLGRTST
ncbi:uncharacterized protein LOC135107247 [Scylla paramamosain]|uniref:uncharacterized protein LOC135107247 n=1 Tax=Scylla paramamosain TaxID=85552 RepID=UPI0030826FDC